MNMKTRVLWWGVVWFFVLFSLVPTFYEISRRNDLQPNRYFELVHNFYTDYNFYLSRIRQGREGALLAYEKYTSEPHERSLMQVFYVLLGRLSHFAHVPWPNSGDTYHVARVVLAATLLFVIAALTKRIFAGSTFWALVAFLLAVTASSWPLLVYHMNEWRFGGFMPWWSLMDALQRITFIPHMLAGQALIVVLLTTLTQDAVMQRPGNWLFLGMLGLLLGIVFPPGLLFVYAALAPLSLFEWRKRHVIVGRALFALLSAPTLLYLSLVLKDYPWKRIADFSILHPLPWNLKEYVLATGPMVPLGLIGMVIALVKREVRLLFLSAWIVAWIALIFVFQNVPGESPLRFTEMLPHVPLGIFAAYLFYNLYNRYTRYNSYIIVFPVLLILLGLGQMYSSWQWQKEFVDHKIRATYPLVPTGSYVMYPLKDVVSAMIFIQDNTSRDTVILSETTAGNYIPVYAGNTVYVGHANTIDTEVKEQIVKRFFSGKMTAADAKQWLASENLRYIFFGPQEKEDGGLGDLLTVYPFLKSIYKNPYVTVYTAKTQD